MARKKKSKFAIAGARRAEFLANAKKAEPSVGFTVPDGEYVAKITAEADVFESGSMKGQAYVRFYHTIAKGDLEGRKPSSLCVVGSENDQQAEIAQEQVIRTLKLLLPDLEAEVAEMPDEGEEGMMALEEFLEELNDRAPLARISAKTTPSKKDKNVSYQNIYINELLEDVEVEEDDEDDDDNSVDEEKEEEVEDKEKEEAPGKGDFYDYKPPRRRKAVVCEVTSVNQARQTVTLKEEENPDNVHKNVSWDDLGDRYED